MSPTFKINKNLMLYLSLFSSLSTLFCCALPALFVGLGFGASLLGIVSAFPGIVALSEYKDWIFLFCSLILLWNGYEIWFGNKKECPTNLEQKNICAKQQHLGKLAYLLKFRIFYCRNVFCLFCP